MRNVLTRRKTACSILAMATVMAVGPTPASAQSFNAAPIGTPINATVTTGTGTTTIDITGQQAVINWNPLGCANCTLPDGSHMFQNPGSTATFQGTSNFAVLNNIVSTNQASTFLGTVQSLVNGQTGGSVYFYNGNGLIVGSTATFNVGSLGLTTIPIGYNATTGDWVTGFGGANPTVNFNPSQPPPMNAAVGGTITTEAGSQINAAMNGSYVAMVAPRIVHQGTITVNGSAALVAAEAATISFSPDGLFTITTQVGTDDPNGVVVDGGTITGPASSGTGDNHRIYAVAVPKNDAVTMAITGGAQLGFEIAGAANVVGNTVILTAGMDVFGSASGPSPAAAAPANISIDNSDFSSTVFANATGDVSLTASNSNVDIAWDFTANGANIFVNSIGDALLGVINDLNLYTAVLNPGEGVNAVAGDITVSTEQFGSLSVGGDVILNANALGGSTSTTGVNSGSGTGGDIYFQATNGGSINVVGGVTATAVGQGGEVFAAGSNGGNGTGGFVGILTIGDVTLTDLAAPGGSMTLGSVYIDVSGYGADGSGGVECFTCNGLSGNGQGGTSWLSAQAGVESSLTVLGSAQMYALGRGGDSLDSVGGNGRGGSLQFFFGNGAQTTVNGLVLMNASGIGGNSESNTGGTGTGGTNYIWRSNADLTSGGLTVGGDLNASAMGTGGNSDSGNGGVGQGGFTGVYTNVGTMDFNAAVNLIASGQGGSSNLGTGGAGFGGVSTQTSNGGTALFAGTNASITIDGALATNADGTGGSSNSGTGGLGRGGEGEVTAAGGTLTLLGTADVSVAGFGGNGTVGGAGIGGGDADAVTGGAIVRAGVDGTLAITGQTIVNAIGVGGTGSSAGGTAQGGVAQVSASSGGDVDLNGLARINSDAHAGGGADGRGGVSIVAASDGSTIDLFQLNLTADGIGGDDIGAGAGNGFGGTATLEASGTGADINLAQSISTGLQWQRETLSADGVGGGTTTSGATGGTGTGGTASLRALAGGEVNLATAAASGNPILIRARGYGGTPGADGTTGGVGVGGVLNLTVDGGTMTAGTTQYSSIGEGGYTLDELLNTSGGDGFGGERHISVLNGGTLTIAIPGGVAGGVGGQATGTGDGGNGSGGLATLTVDNATLNVTGNLIIASQIAGGGAIGSGNAGSATGGNTTTVNITNGAVINIAAGATLGLTANAFGGFASGSGSGGDASSGNVTVNVANATITGGMLVVGSQASGGGSTAGAGGDATSANATLNLDNVSFAGEELFVYASGFGGSTQNGAGGSGTGGNAQLNNVGGASTIAATGLLGVAAEGIGGSIGDGSGTTGSGFGGNASIFAASGTTLTFDGNVGVSAVGESGEFVVMQGSPSGNGGSGDAGSANVYTQGGTIAFNDSLTIDASAQGGNGIGGTGGSALGGNASLGLQGGAISVGGALTIDGSATGGSGTIGGNATALLSPPANEESPVAAGIYANGGGTISVTGATTMSAYATGGAGSAGNGGNATAGEAEVIAYFGDITLGALTMDANALGGSGGLGGNGGAGLGGGIDVAFGLGAAAVGGTITIASATIGADGTGGAGGAGAGANTGGNGGSGGAGTGGGVIFAGSAGGGSLISGNTVINARGFGGAGGAGGNGDTGPGGNGGAGGVATGGFIQSGTVSAAGAPGSGGDFTVTDLALDTSASGGAGGNAGIGCGGTGTGGNGGNASGGESYLWIRGVDATAGNVLLRANASGGNGGSGSIGGNGGNAVTGLVAVEAKDRFNVPTQRGSLVANSINAVAVATGGNGATAGTSTVLGGSFFRVLNGDADIGSVDFTIGGDLFDGSFYTNYVSVRDGTALIGDFSFTTTGELALDASNGSMTADTISLSAGTFVPNRPDVPAPTSIGTYSAGTFDIVTDGNFITNANLDSVSLLEIIAPGSITAADLTGDAEVYLNAQSGSIAVNNIDAALDVRLDAATGITANNLTSDFFINANTGGALTINNAVSADDTLLSGTASVTFAAITSGTLTNIDSNGSINGGNIVAGGTVSLFASNLGSAIDVGNINSGGDISLTAPTILAGDLTAAGFINLFAGGLDTIIVSDLEGDGVYATALGNITTGDITSTLDVAIESFEGTITTQNITAATQVDLDAAGNIIFLNASADDFNFSSGGAVTGGNIVATTHADGEAQGAIALGDVTVSGPPVGDDFSIGFKSATSILVGNVSGSDRVGFATFGDLTTGNLSAGSLVMTLVGGDIVTGSITTDPSGQVYMADSSMFVTGGGSISDVEDNFDASIVLALDPVATGGSITINGPVSTGLFRAAAGAGFDSGIINASSLGLAADTIEAGDINSDVAVVLSAASGISTGNIASDDFVALTSANGNIATGDIDSAFDIDLQAAGSIATGDLSAGTSVMIDAGGNVTTGDILAGLGAPVLAQTIGTQDVGPGEPVEIFSDGSIVTGDITTDGYVGLYAADDITAGAITAEHDVIALAGGDASFGAITTPERFILAGYGNFDDLSNSEFFDAELIFGLFPIESTGGSATFAGSSDVGQFEAYVGGNATVASITADSEAGGFIDIDAGGLLSINGTVNAGQVSMTSSDIAIGQAAAITGDYVDFNSLSTDGTYIGDGLQGTDGYRLTQAELDRVTASNMSFEVLTDRGAETLMVLGDLSLDFSGNGEDDDPVEFTISEDIDEETAAGGIIRIVGDVEIVVDPQHEVEFEAETFEIDAATGSLALLNSTGQLSGILSLEANNIFIASGDILAQLEADPRYDGYIDDLNAPAAVQRPEGVLRAAIVTLGEEAGDLENILIQNTGSGDTPAGFVISELTFGEDGEEEEIPQPGSINMVINGQIETQQGTLTGDEVRTVFVEEFGTEIFVEGSTVNGCDLSGNCGGDSTGSPQEQQPITPTQVAILASDPLGESVFGNEGDIDDNSESDDSGAASSPIDAPQPLFDTRPLSSDEDISEPVSGAGNPSLYGLTSGEADDEDEEEDGKEKAKPAGEANGRSGDGQ